MSIRVRARARGQGQGRGRERASTHRTESTFVAKTNMSLSSRRAYSGTDTGGDTGGTGTYTDTYTDTAMSDTHSSYSSHALAEHGTDHTGSARPSIGTEPYHAVTASQPRTSSRTVHIQSSAIADLTPDSDEDSASSPEAADISALVNVDTQPVSGDITSGNDNSTREEAPGDVTRGTNSPQVVAASMSLVGSSAPRAAWQQYEDFAHSAPSSPAPDSAPAPPSTDRKESLSHLFDRALPSHRSIHDEFSQSMNDPFQSSLPEQARSGTDTEIDSDTGEDSDEKLEDGVAVSNAALSIASTAVDTAMHHNPQTETSCTAATLVDGIQTNAVIVSEEHQQHQNTLVSPFVIGGSQDSQVLGSDIPGMDFISDDEGEKDIDHVVVPFRGHQAHQSQPQQADDTVFVAETPPCTDVRHGQAGAIMHDSAAPTLPDDYDMVNPNQAQCSSLPHSSIASNRDVSTWRSRKPITQQGASASQGNDDLLEFDLFPPNDTKSIVLESTIGASAAAVASSEAPLVQDTDSESDADLHSSGSKSKRFFHLSRPKAPLSPDATQEPPSEPGDLSFSTRRAIAAARERQLQQQQQQQQQHQQQQQLSQSPEVQSDIQPTAATVTEVIAESPTIGSASIDYDAPSTLFHASVQWVGDGKLDPAHNRRYYRACKFHLSVPPGRTPVAPVHAHVGHHYLIRTGQSPESCHSADSESSEFHIVRILQLWEQTDHDPDDAHANACRAKVLWFQFCSDVAREVIMGNAPTEVAVVSLTQWCVVKYYRNGVISDSNELVEGESDGLQEYQSHSQSNNVPYTCRTYIDESESRCSVTHAYLHHLGASYADDHCPSQQTQKINASISGSQLAKEIGIVNQVSADSVDLLDTTQTQRRESSKRHATTHVRDLERKTHANNARAAATRAKRTRLLAVGSDVGDADGGHDCGDDGGTAPTLADSAHTAAGVFSPQRFRLSTTNTPTRNRGTIQRSVFGGNSSTATTPSSFTPRVNRRTPRRRRQVKTPLTPSPRMRIVRSSPSVAQSQSAPAHRGMQMARAREINRSARVERGSPPPIASIREQTHCKNNAHSDADIHHDIDQVMASCSASSNFESQDPDRGDASLGDQTLSLDRASSASVAVDESAHFEPNLKFMRLEYLSSLSSADTVNAGHYVLIRWADEQHYLARVMSSRTPKLRSSKRARVRSKRAVSTTRRIGVKYVFWQKDTHGVWTQIENGTSTSTACDEYVNKFDKVFTLRSSPGDSQMPWNRQLIEFTLAHRAHHNYSCPENGPFPSPSVEAKSESQVASQVESRVESQAEPSAASRARSNPTTRARRSLTSNVDQCHTSAATEPLHASHASLPEMDLNLQSGLRRHSRPCPTTQEQPTSSSEIKATGTLPTTRAYEIVEPAAVARSSRSQTAAMAAAVAASIASSSLHEIASAMPTIARGMDEPMEKSTRRVCDIESPVKPKPARVRASASSSGTSFTSPFAAELHRASLHVTGHDDVSMEEAMSQALKLKTHSHTVFSGYRFLLTGFRDGADLPRLNTIVEERYQSPREYDKCAREAERRMYVQDTNCVRVDKMALSKVIEEYGGTVVERLSDLVVHDDSDDSVQCSKLADVKRDDHIIVLSDQPRRTQKYLFALARGTVVLTADWLLDCIRDAKVLLPVHNNTFVSKRWVFDRGLVFRDGRIVQIGITCRYVKSPNGIQPVPVEERIFHGCSFAVAVQPGSSTMSGWKAVGYAAGAARVIELPALVDAVTARVHRRSDNQKQMHIAQQLQASDMIGTVIIENGLKLTDQEKRILKNIRIVESRHFVDSLVCQKDHLTQPTFS
jgi:BRCA1 C Terminus (BRCT) domain